MTTIPRESSDASWAYTERTGIDIARVDSSAKGDALAALTRGATFATGNVTFVPMYVPMIEQIAGHDLPQFIIEQ